MEAFGDRWADVGGFVLWSDVFSEFRRPFVNGLACELSSLHQAPAEPGCTWEGDTITQWLVTQSRVFPN